MVPESRVLAEPEALRPAIVLIAPDPTPWIHPRLRALCSRAQSTAEHLERLDALLRTRRGDLVIVAVHSPMRTGGPRGGLSYGFMTDLFVTPLGWMMGGLGNTDESGHAEWIEAAEAVMRRNPPEIYAAGHDHNLRIFDARGVAGVLVVGGAGAVERVSTVTTIPDPRFAHAVPGFIAVDFGLRGGEPGVVLRVTESNEKDPTFEWALPLD